MTVQLTDPAEVKGFDGLALQITERWRYSARTRFPMPILPANFQLKYYPEHRYSDLDKVSAEANSFLNIIMHLPTGSTDSNDSSFWEGVVPLLANVVAHERTHICHWTHSAQTMHAAAKRQKCIGVNPNSPGDMLLNEYYGLRHEVEAHAAQIAFQLCLDNKWAKPTISRDVILATFAGRRVQSRLSNPPTVHAAGTFSVAVEAYWAGLEEEIDAHVTAWT